MASAFRPRAAQQSGGFDCPRAQSQFPPYCREVWWTALPLMEAPALQTLEKYKDLP